MTNVYIKEYYLTEEIMDNEQKKLSKEAEKIVKEELSSKYKKNNKNNEFYSL